MNPMPVVCHRYVFKAMSQSVKVGITWGPEAMNVGNYGKWRVLQPRTSWLKVLRRRIFTHGLMECFRHPYGAMWLFGERKKFTLLPVIGRAPESTRGCMSQCGATLGLIPSKPWPILTFRCSCPEEFLMMTDGFSMAWSLEARPPLLDRTR